MQPPAPDDPLLGQVIDDRYRILKVIGRGGMGVVYEAEATRLGKRLCAVKVLLPEFTRDENVVARFTREAQVAGRVKHPNVVEIFDTGTTQDGLGFIAMELLRGESLHHTLQRDGALPWPRAQRIILQICRALSAAHAEGIAHRDMKPENCFRCSRGDEDDFIKVLDFGIAKLIDPEANREAGRLTATNSVIGTCSYMAYEQVCGDEIDHRVDVWASGVILYEMLTGQRPFRGNNQGQIWRAITESDPAPMRTLAPRANIPAALEPIVRQALAKSLPDRYPSIEAFARALASVPADDAVRSITAKLAVVEHHESTGATVGPIGGRGMVTEPGSAPMPPVPRRAVWPLVGLTLTSVSMALAVWLSLGTSEKPPASPASLPDAPAKHVVDDTPVLPDAPPPPPQVTPQPIPVPAPVAEPEPEPAPPTPKTTPTEPKKPASSFAKRASKALQEVRTSAGLRSCFSDAVPSMIVDVRISAVTGIGTVVVPALKVGGRVALCIERAFKAPLLSKGAPGEKDYTRKQLTLSR